MVVVDKTPANDTLFYYYTLAPPQSKDDIVCIIPIQICHLGGYHLVQKPLLSVGSNVVLKYPGIQITTQD